MSILLRALDESRQVRSDGHRLKGTDGCSSGIAVGDETHHGLGSSTDNPEHLSKNLSQVTVVYAPRQHRQVNRDMPVGRGLTQYVCSLEMKELLVRATVILGSPGLF